MASAMGQIMKVSTVNMVRPSREIIEANVSACRERDRLDVIAAASGNLVADNQSNSEISMKRKVHALSSIGDLEFLRKLTKEVWG